MNIPLVTEHLQQREEETVTSGTSGVSNPTAALAPFPTRAAAFFPLKAGKPSWPHLPAPSRPSSRHVKGLVLQAQPPGSTCSVTSGAPPVTTDPLSSPQDEIHTSLFVSSSLLSFPDKLSALGNKKYSPGRYRGRDEHRGSRPASPSALARAGAAVCRHHLRFR